MLPISYLFVVCRVLVAFAVAVVMLSAGVPKAAAQSADTAVAPKFRIVRFEIEGNTLLSATEIKRVVAPYTGDGKDFGDIQRGLEALEQSYRSHGYGTVQVMLPEQDITRGVVRLQVVEPHLNGPGGDVPVILHDVRRDKTEVICGQGVAPAGATIAHYKSEGLDLVPGTGLLAAVVPGTFETWMMVLRGETSQWKRSR